MPGQSQLYVGQPVDSYEAAVAVYERLGIEVGEDVFDGRGEGRVVEFRGREVPVYICGMREDETGERAVGFALTGRYEEAVLDAGKDKGRPDLFVFDPADIEGVLEEVRAWWPEAVVFLWDRFY